MNRKEKKKFIHYSIAFYKKDQLLQEVVKKTNAEFVNLMNHLKILKQNTMILFTKFNSQTKSEQKQQLQANSETIIQAFIEIIQQLNHNRQLMLYTIPTLQSILVCKISQQNIPSIQGQLNKSARLIISNKVQEAQFYKIILIRLSINLQPKLFPFFSVTTKANTNKYNSFSSYLKLKMVKKKRFVSMFQYLASLIYSSINMSPNNSLNIRDTKCITELIRLTQILVKNSSDLQISYYTILNFWLLSYVNQSISIFADPNIGILRTVIQIIQKISRQKIIRISFNLFSNLWDEPLCIELMSDLKMIKLIDFLMKGNIKDKQLVDQITKLGQILQNNMKFLTFNFFIRSFQKYMKELHGQNLEWGPLHSERFWKEHVKKFQEDDFMLTKYLFGYRKLYQLLDSNRQTNIAIACHDLGEFSRFHPFGRKILESIGAKNKILQIAKNIQNKQIRQHALLALQKIMIHNWQII